MDQVLSNVGLGDDSKIPVSSHLTKKETAPDILLEDDETFLLSKHFAVTLYKMLQAVSKNKPMFMNWTIDGSSFYIDYSIDNDEMSDVIKPFFKRKTYKVDAFCYCLQTLSR